MTIEDQLLAAQAKIELLEARIVALEASQGSGDSAFDMDAVDALLKLIRRR